MKFLMLTGLIFLMAVRLGAQTIVAVPTPAEMAQKGFDVVSKYKGSISAQPKNFINPKTTDGALGGNGDLGVVIGGPPENLTFFYGKNEFWTTSIWHKDFPDGGHTDGGGLLPMAHLDLAAPSLAGATYSLEEELATAEVQGKFMKGATGLTFRSWVAATENLHVVEFTAVGGSIALKAKLAHALDSCYRVYGKDGDAIWLLVSADGKLELPGPDVKLATRILGVTATVDATNNLVFTVPVGTTVTMVSAILSDRDDPGYDSAAVRRVKTATAEDIASLNQTHRDWWKAFYAKSAVEIADTTLEKYWYSSLYLLGCESRAREVAPGLWGNWATTHEMKWRGDYTLNYNYTSNFLSFYSSNHIELTENYDKPILDWIPLAQAEAKKLGYQGVLFKSHIGPLPGGTVDTNRWSEVYDGNLVATGMFLRYWHTYDLDYAKTFYPFLLQLDAFWQSYMQFQNGEYEIPKDEIGEAASTSTTSNYLTVSTLEMVYTGLLEISDKLGVDADKRAKWQDILNHLPPYAKTAAGDKFKCAESGVGDGCVTIYPISFDPSFGLESPKDTLTLAYNTVKYFGAWTGGNWLAYFYQAIARMGHDPVDLQNKLKTLIQTQSYPNLHLTSAGGGLENLSTVPACLNEMLLQSNQGVLRVFSDWPKTMDAKFFNLRAYGAFLVSSELKGGEVQYVTIVSEKGRPAIVRNPWPGKNFYDFRNGVKSGPWSGDKVTLPTAAGETVVLLPEGKQVGLKSAEKTARDFQVSVTRRDIFIAAPHKGDYQIRLMTTDGKKSEAFTFMHQDQLRLALPSSSHSISSTLYYLEIREIAVDGNLEKTQVSIKRVPIIP